jgi:hypothetical protein
LATASSASTSGLSVVADGAAACEAATCGADKPMIDARMAKSSQLRRGAALPRRRSSSRFPITLAPMRGPDAVQRI